MRWSSSKPLPDPLRRRAWQAGASLLFTLCGCERAPQPPAAAKAGAEAPQPASPIVGAWRMREPLTFMSEGVAVETRDSRTDYRPDGRFVYVARLSVSGGKLPARGLGFGMSAEGRWSMKDGILTERFTSALVRPDGEGGPQLDLLADAMSEEAARRPPSRSDVLVAEAGELMLRDRETQKIVTYERVR